MVLVGHGVVVRQVRGPATAAGRPEQVELSLRRYRCRACRAVVVVGPRGLVRRRWYRAGAIALAVAAHVRGATSAAIRALTCPAAVVGVAAVERWATLRRWLEAARRGELFGLCGMEALSLTQVAEQVMLTLAARGGHVRGADLAVSAFEGAALAA